MNYRNLLWHSFKHRYSTVRGAGGTTPETVPLTATREQILSMCTGKYFPNGQNDKRGPLSNFKYCLGNRKAEVIVGDEWTLKRHIDEQPKESKLTFFLLTKAKSVSTILEEYATVGEFIKIYLYI